MNLKFCWAWGVQLRILASAACLLDPIAALPSPCPPALPNAQTEAAPPGHSRQLSHYESRSYFIPMRDGVKLHTIVLRPKSSRTALPFLLTRSPYGIDTPEARPSDAFLKAGYIFVLQDVRGRFKSQGTFVQMTPHLDIKLKPQDIDESTDTYDTIDWLLKNIHPNNGNVGLTGISYLGFYAAAGMIDAHPALKAVSPQAPQADWFVGDDVHHNGVLMLNTSFGLMSAMAQSGDRLSQGAGVDFGTQDGYQFFLQLGPLANADLRFFHGAVPKWTELMEHGTYDDYWKSRNILPHLRNIRPAVLVVGGWYDAFDLYGALHVFAAVRDQSPATSLTLVMGPWLHGQWNSKEDGSAIGALRFGSKTTDYFSQHTELPFFEAYLKHNRKPSLPPVIVFETGANHWHRLKAWPPTAGAERSIYLRESGSLSFEPPPETQGSHYDEYVSDPAKPVPYVERPGVYLDTDYMTHDQRFGSRRPDVLSYTGDVLQQDLTVAGPISPQLWVSTTATDADFVVKLIDIHPETEVPISTQCPSAIINGYQELVRGDVMRSKFRTGLERPESLLSGEITRLDFSMPDVFHTFKKGHRMMVQIQSSWFPLVDLNPQSFVDIYHASPADFQRATQRVYRSSRESSRVLLRVWNAGLPDNDRTP